MSDDSDVGLRGREVGSEEGEAEGEGRRVSEVASNLWARKRVDLVDTHGKGDGRANYSLRGAHEVVL